MTMAYTDRVMSLLCNHLSRRSRFTTGLLLITCSGLLLHFYWNATPTNGRNKMMSDFDLLTEWAKVLPLSEKLSEAEIRSACEIGILNVTFPCPTVKFGDNKLPICTYTSLEDNTVSQSFLAGQYWDEAHINEILAKLREYPDHAFFDIGANIGAYSLAVAHSLRRRVVAVEANPETFRRLAASICLGNVSSLIRLIPRAISNKVGASRLAQGSRNPGVTVVLNSTACDLTRPSITCINTSIHTITLDDMLPLMNTRRVILKIDVEGSEINIFNEKTASRFFSKIDIPLIYMEFTYYTRFYAKDPLKRETVVKMLDFFLSRDYNAHGSGNKTLQRDEWMKWPDDIVWIRKN